MEEQAIWFGFHSRINPRAKAKKGLQTSPSVHSHTKNDDDKIGIGGEIDRAAVYLHGCLQHEILWLRPSGASSSATTNGTVSTANALLDFQRRQLLATKS